MYGSEDPLLPIRFEWRYGGHQVHLCGSFTRWLETVPMAPSSLEPQVPPRSPGAARADKGKTPPAVCTRAGWRKGGRRAGWDFVRRAFRLGSRGCACGDPLTPQLPVVPTPKMGSGQANGVAMREEAYR